MFRSDVVVIGAGPCGLFQVFELGLQGLSVTVIDALGESGGQCINLYPDKPIYDIPAIPEISAADLTGQLMQQIEPFNAEFLFHQRVIGIQGEAGDFKVICASGLSVACSAVIIAGGAGAFRPVKLKIEGLEQLEERSVFYKVQDKEIHRDKHLVIVGGGDSALDWALALRGVAASVTLIHRSDRFRAHPVTIKAMQESCAQQEMLFFQGRIIDYVAEQTTLKSVRIKGRDQVVRTAQLDHLLVFFGLTPDSTGYESWGLELYQKQIKVRTDSFATNRKGIYAVGDINYYPGKRKLILSGFHEAALAAFAIKEQLEPTRKATLQYTTTSPLMHQRLGKHPDLSDMAN